MTELDRRFEFPIKCPKRLDHRADRREYPQVWVSELRVWLCTDPECGTMSTTREVELRVAHDGSDAVRLDPEREAYDEPTR